jgi:hypothetical protein
VATLSPVGAGPGLCAINGRTEPFSAGKLKTLYGTAANFIAQWTAATDSAIAKGFIVRADRSRLIAIGRKLSEHIE